MNKKSDTSMVKVLELVALTGEMNSDEIKSFSSSPSYAEKLITQLKKESYLKKFKGEGKATLRLTAKGKSYLKAVLPECFENALTGQKTMNRVRDDKRRNERRSKLIELLLIMHRADVKILPDEKNLLKSTSVDTRADTTDITDKNRLEFYTSAEIKNEIPDYTNSVGSRSLGVLAAKGRLYIVYSTVDGDLLWRQDTEYNFYRDTLGVLSKKLFGESVETYLLVIGEKTKAVVDIMKRWGEKRKGKIYPSEALPMIFALKDCNKDATLDFILRSDDTSQRLTEMFASEVTFDKKHSFADGVRRIKYRDEFGNISERETLYVCAFLFEPNRICSAVEYSVNGNREVNILCFDYQKEYIEAYIKSYAAGKTHHIEILSNSVEGYKENYLNE